MNATQLKELVKKNNGATLTSNGKRATIKKGFIVSEEKHGLILGLKEFYKLTDERLNAYIRKAHKLGALLGFWVNENKVYIDFNKHISDKAQAIAYGQEQHQLAIWSCANECEIAIKSE